VNGSTASLSNFSVSSDGTLSGSGAIFKIMLTGTQSFTDSFWNKSAKYAFREHVFSSVGPVELIS